MDKSITIKSTLQIAALIHQHKLLSEHLEKTQKELAELSQKINNEITNLELLIMVLILNSYVHS